MPPGEREIGSRFHFKNSNLVNYQIVESSIGYCLSFKIAAYGGLLELCEQFRDRTSERRHFAGKGSGLLDRGRHRPCLRQLRPCSSAYVRIEPAYFRTRAARTIREEAIG